MAESFVRELEGHPHTPCLRQPTKPHGLWKASWGGGKHNGSLSGTVPDQTLISQKSSSQVANVVGSTRRHHAWTKVKRLSGLREGLELVSPWPPVQLVASPGSNRSSFALSSFAASISLFPCPRASAGVAFHSIFVHHRAACTRAGIWGRREYPLETVTARICREAGGRVTTNVVVRDLDLAEPHVADSRRLEVVADGLPLFWGAQLAIDTTIVSTLHANGKREVPMWMGQPCPQLDDARKGPSQNSLVVQGALVWWCSVSRSVAVGQLRPSRF